MSAWVTVQCDYEQCEETWESDDFGGSESATVAGAFEYLSDMDVWVRSEDSERIYCCQEHYDLEEPYREEDDEQ